MDTDMIWEMILKVVKNINIVAYKKYAIFLEIIFLFKKTAPIKGLLINITNSFLEKIIKINLRTAKVHFFIINSNQPKILFSPLRFYLAFYKKSESAHLRSLF